ncbi:2-isopropylmalate synthase [Pyrenophora seminiperda CCB06]|uniref:2-isopropylmalate synthase n=1 Tax=Pyrenophora seminiperda CCB06 TaxID=1302712 RepID=A0A3M7MIM5_9PLEO|nr:2-isopropylmalate synthase [Pyrenophora seminiperda CCB06]
MLLPYDPGADIPHAHHLYSPLHCSIAAVMKEQKQNKVQKNNSIRNFFAPLPKDTTSSRTASSSTTVPQKKATDAPILSEGAHSATSNVPNTLPPSSDPSISNASSIVIDALPFTPSQTSAHSAASRRITSNGQQVVLNSDSDDDSLQDVDFGLGTPNARITPKPTITTIDSRSKRKSDDEDDGLRMPEKKSKGDKHKFDTFLQTVQQKIETEQRIKEHKAVLEAADEEPMNNVVAITEDTFGQVVQDEDDPDKAHRLFLAMQRTSATQTQSTFHFFGDPVHSISPMSKFPVMGLPHQRWLSLLEDPSAREQAFMTGFVQQIVRIQQLPEELAAWMIDEFCRSDNESLNSKYLDILQSHCEHFRTLLNPERLHFLFEAINANMGQLDQETELAPISLPESEHCLPLPQTLKSIARLLAGVAPWWADLMLRTETRTRALFILFHVCLDDRVVADPDILCVIQDAIEAIICNFVDNHRLNSAVGSPLPQHVQSLISSQLSDVIPQLLAKVTHPVLQRNLICALPSRSPLTAYLQRHLALAFLVYPISVDVPLADPKVSELLLDHLDTSSSYRKDRDIEYGSLAAQLSLLDIAIGPGLLTVPYQPLSSPTTSQASSPSIRAPLPTTSEVKIFNSEVDTLVRQIKLLGNSIVEVGAGDLSILETKDCIERLCARLEHAVRIGGKKVHDVFGNDEDHKQPKVNNFFKPTTPALSRSIFDEDEDGA